MTIIKPYQEEEEKEKPCLFLLPSFLMPILSFGEKQQLCEFLKDWFLITELLAFLLLLLLTSFAYPHPFKFADSPEDPGNHPRESNKFLELARSIYVVFNAKHKRTHHFDVMKIATWFQYVPIVHWFKIGMCTSTRDGQKFKNKLRICWKNC